MKLNDLKHSIDSVKADDYLETRLFAKVSEAQTPKRRAGKAFKIAVSAALCLTVLAAGVGIGIPKNAISDGNNNLLASDVDYSGNYFVMSVYAAENDKKTAMPIDDHTVVLPDYKIKKIFSSDSLEIHGSSNQSGFEIKGENIKTVEIKCKTGSFNIWNFDMLHYLRDNGMYYDVIVPYSDEYEIGGTDKRLDIMFKHIQNGDYDEYIKGKDIKPYDEYAGVDFIYDDSVGIDENIVGVGLVSKESFEKIHPKGFLEEYTFENVLNRTTEIGDCFSWHPDTDVLFDNPDMSLTKLPHDTISVEVTFNDNSVQHASYDFSFNNNGELVIDRIAE